MQPMAVGLTRIDCVLAYISEYRYSASVNAFDVLGDPVRRPSLELLAGVELEHFTPTGMLDELVRTYGPGGAIGVGWSLALVELDLFLNGTAFGPETWEDTPEAKGRAWYA